MSVARSILMRMFCRPQGLLGKVGGVIMARMNSECAAWVIDLLHIQPNDKVLEVGFGPGVGIQLAAELAATGYVAGVDPSEEMVDSATKRNATTTRTVDVRRGSAESLPFEDNVFDKAFAINSMQVWPDAIAGLREIRRVLKGGARIALGFTPYSGQRKTGLIETLTAAGFTDPKVVEGDKGFCAIATKPSAEARITPA
jgi:ubiquinone/menaquinone biosynthesis C-methylase UbiE